jgi:four helix bundle protein
MTEEHPPNCRDKGRKFDLGERTARFGEDVIRFVRKIKLDPVASPLVRQIVRSATSVGANYAEADEAGLKKEFRYRVSVCLREARETKHWLRMIAVASPQSKDDARRLWQEANELTRIFAAIYRNSKPKDPS